MLRRVVVSPAVAARRGLSTAVAAGTLTVRQRLKSTPIDHRVLAHIQELGLGRRGVGNPRAQDAKLLRLRERRELQEKSDSVQLLLSGEADAKLKLLGEQKDTPPPPAAADDGDDGGDDRDGDGGEAAGAAGGGATAAGAEEVEVWAEERCSARNPWW